MTAPPDLLLDPPALLRLGVVLLPVLAVAEVGGGLVERVLGEVGLDQPLLVGGRELEVGGDLPRRPRLAAARIHLAAELVAQPLEVGEQRRELPGVAFDEEADRPPRARRAVEVEGAALELGELVDGERLLLAALAVDAPQVGLPATVLLRPDEAVAVGEAVDALQDVELDVPAHPEPDPERLTAETPVPPPPPDPLDHP